VYRNKVAVAIAAVVLLAAVVSTWQAIRATHAEWEQSRLRGEVEAALKKEEQQRHRAEAEELAALRRAYNSDMTLAHQALAANNYGRVVGLMNRYRPTAEGPDLRRWEWRYFWNQSRSEAAFALPRQPDAIAGVALSPDGRLLVSSELSGRLRLWDLGQRTELMTLQDPGLDVRQLVFSHDGTRLATVFHEARQSVVRIWAVAERKMILEVPCNSRLRALAFCPDDSRLLLLGQDLSLSEWDFQTEQLDPLRPGNSLAGRSNRLAIFSPDCRRIAYLDAERIHVLDVATGSEIADLEGRPGGTWCIAFSPDAEFLAAGPSPAAMSTEIKLFSLDSEQQVRGLAGHASWVPAITFTDDGKQLVSAGADQTIRIWDVARAREQAILSGHLSEVYQVAVSSDGKTIVSGCKDGTILAWDAENIHHRNRFETLPISVNQLHFLPNGREMLSVNADGSVTLWDSQSLEQKESLQALRRDVRQLFVSSDGTRLFAGTRRGEVKVLDWPTRQVITTLRENKGRPTALTPVGLSDHDHTLVVLGGGAVRLIDTASWETQVQWPIETLGRWFGKAPAVCSGKGLVAFGSVRQPLRLLNLATGQTQTIEAAAPWGASDLAFSSDGRLLAISSLEGIVRLCDTTSFEVVSELRGHLIGVNAVAFSSDGQRLASASQGEEAIKLWDVPTGQEVVTLPGEGLISGSLAFSPDGNVLTGVNAQGKAHIWRAPSFDEIRALETPANGQLAR
jgi:WD40 repeat protein